MTATLEAILARAEADAAVARENWEAGGSLTTVPGLHAVRENPAYTALNRAEQRVLAAAVALARRQPGGQVGSHR
jgi:hypothetical protein